MATETVGASNDDQGGSTAVAGTVSVDPSTIRTVTRMEFSPSNVWRTGFVVLGVVAIGLALKFLIEDGGSVIFTILMSWFAAIAAAPLVNRLARHMKRGLAIGIVLVGTIVFVVVFFAAFGVLLFDQLSELVLRVPSLIDGVLTWVNSNFSTSLSRDEVLSSVNLTPDQITAAASTLGVSVLGFLGTAVGAVFSMFTFGLFIFYLSADMPRLERWVASLFPPRQQDVVATVWKLTMEKTGGYVGARVVLAGISAGATAIVFLAIGMPYWLALALWTGIVAQFVPTVGTSISIALPVIVGLLSPNPTLGVIALIWGLIYQQIENLTIEPKISAKAVNVNPAVSFGAVLLGAALFGVAGAFLAVPVIAMLLALLEIYGKRHEILPKIDAGVASTEYHPKPRRHPTPEPAPGAAQSPVSAADPA